MAAIKIKQDGEWVKLPNYGVQEGLPEAPKDGKTYGRKDGTWSEVTVGSDEDADKIAGVISSLIGEDHLNINDTIEDTQLQVLLDVVPNNTSTIYRFSAPIMAVVLTQGAYITEVYVARDDSQDGIMVSFSNSICAIPPYSVKDSVSLIIQISTKAVKQAITSYNTLPMNGDFGIVWGVKDNISSSTQESGSIALKTSGDGTKFLADDGEYKEVSGGGSSSSLDFATIAEVVNNLRSNAPSSSDEQFATTITSEQYQKLEQMTSGVEEGIYEVTASDSDMTNMINCYGSAVYTNKVTLVKANEQFMILINLPNFCFTNDYMLIGTIIIYIFGNLSVMYDANLITNSPGGVLGTIRESNVNQDFKKTEIPIASSEPIEINGLIDLDSSSSSENISNVVGGVDGFTRIYNAINSGYPSIRIKSGRLNLYPTGDGTTSESSYKTIQFSYSYTSMSKLISGLVWIRCNSDGSFTAGKEISGDYSS